MFANTDIYTNKYLKYPLTKEERSLVPEAWDLLRVFKKRFVFVSDYRNYLIKTVSSNYTVEKFYKLETVLNKMFWNLRWLLFPLWTNQYITREEYQDFVKEGYDNFETLPYSLLLCTHQKYPAGYTRRDIKNMLRNNDDTFYRSFINKLVLVDKSTNTIIIKPMEGSSDIFSKNYFNIMTFHILFSKSTYEAVMEEPFLVKSMSTLQPSHFYYQFDYGFPNLNSCRYSIGTYEDKLDRIRKMYFTGGAEYWFRLII